MYDAPKDAKLLAYTSLCRPILDYADVVWDPAVRSKIHEIELVQNSTIRFISNMKGRADSVSEARNELGLRLLEDRQKNHRLCLLTRILQNEDQHQSLSRAYDEIIEDRELVTVTTRAAARGELISISSRKNLFHTSFLPRTIREMRGEYKTNYKTANAVTSANPGLM